MKPCSASNWLFTLGKLFNLCLGFLVYKMEVILLSTYYILATVLNALLR